jgi:hypothetical protein
MIGEGGYGKVYRGTVKTKSGPQVCSGLACLSISCAALVSRLLKAKLERAPNILKVEYRVPEETARLWVSLMFRVCAVAAHRYCAANLVEKILVTLG